jgi:hypothetical protein
MSVRVILLAIAAADEDRLALHDLVHAVDSVVILLEP